MIQPLFLHEYSHAVRDTVLRAKAGDTEATWHIAASLAPFIPEGATIVPLPSHSGRPSHMEAIARTIAEMRGDGITVRVSMGGRERPSQYRTKKAGGLLRGDDLGFFLVQEEPQGKVILLDDVIGTGNTMATALRLLPQAQPLCYALDVKTYGNPSLPLETVLLPVSRLPHVIAGIAPQRRQEASSAPQI